MDPFICTIKRIEDRSLSTAGSALLCSDLACGVEQKNRIRLQVQAYCNNPGRQPFPQVEFVMDGKATTFSEFHRVYNALQVNGLMLEVKLPA